MRFLIFILFCICFSHTVFAQSMTIDTRTITDRLARPWDIAFINTGLALISEKEGSLVKVDLHNGDKTLIRGMPEDLDSRNRTGIGDNSGIFGVVLDPDFSHTSRIFMAYAARDFQNLTTTKVISATLKDNTLTDIRTLLVASPYSEDRYHYGGGLVFGGDNTLYITVGERLFSEADQPSMPIAQNYGDRRGKIYRINRDGSVPEDNPRWPADSAKGMFALGIRAAQGLTRHPTTGQIWFSEHGTRQGDEINVLKGGANYGWPVVTTGGYRAQAYVPPPLDDRTFTPPAWFWPTTVAPTGLHFYSGEQFPQLQNTLLVAGLSRGSLWRMVMKGEKITGGEPIMTGVRLRKVAQSPSGALYLLSDEANGRLLEVTKVIPAAHKARDN